MRPSISFIHKSELSIQITQETIIDRMSDMMQRRELAAPYICGNCKSFFTDHAESGDCLFRPTKYREATGAELGEIYRDLGEH